MAKAMETASEPKPAVPRTNGHHDLFTRVAGWTIRATGGRWGFLCALGSVLIWLVCGPFFKYSQNWQLVINTGTTIVTFLMVFLIQNAQNRESKATHLKLDELIVAVKLARNEMIDVERLSDEQLDKLAERYSKIAGQHQHKLQDCFDQVDAAREECAIAHMTVK